METAILWQRCQRMKAKLGWQVETGMDGVTKHDLYSPSHSHLGENAFNSIRLDSVGFGSVQFTNFFFFLFNVKQYAHDTARWKKVHI